MVETQVGKFFSDEWQVEQRTVEGDQNRMLAKHICGIWQVDVFHENMWPASIICADYRQIIIITRQPGCFHIDEESFVSEMPVQSPIFVLRQMITKEPDVFPLEGLFSIGDVVPYSAPFGFPETWLNWWRCQVWPRGDSRFPEKLFGFGSYAWNEEKGVPH